MTFKALPQWSELTGRYIRGNLDSPYGTLRTRVGRSWSGDDNPNFRTEISQHKQATNRYDMLFTKHLMVKSARFSADVLPPYWSYYGYENVMWAIVGQGDNTAAFDEAEVANNTDIAMGKVFKQLANDQLAFGGLELVAEFKDTLHTIKHPAESLAAYLNRKASDLIAKKAAYTRKREHIAKSKLSRKEIIRRLGREEKLFNKTLAASWLELQFGAKPFLNEINSIAQTSVDTFPEKGSTKLFVAQSKSVKTVTYENPNVSMGYYRYNELFEDWYEYTTVVKARKTATGEFDGMSTLEYLAKKGGFSLPQVIPLLWELTPLSVFVDMFVNVGDVLQATVTETHNITSVDVYSTRKLIRRRKISIEPLYSYTFDIHPYPATRDGVIVTLFKRYTREASALAIPAVRFGTPIGNLSQTLNLSAFLYSVNR